MDATFRFIKVAWLWCFMFHRNHKVVTENFIIEPTGDKYFRKRLKNEPLVFAWCFPFLIGQYLHLGIWFYQKHLPYSWGQVYWSRLRNMSELWKNSPWNHYSPWIPWMVGKGERRWWLWRPALPILSVRNSPISCEFKQRKHN